MKLQAFRIQYYRSIIDTKWCDLSPDNITVLIGQNESGKTSILEALRSFYTGKILQEDIRSDSSQLQVACSFIISKEELSKILIKSKLPTEVMKVLQETGYRINIVRTWNTLKDTSLKLEEKRLIAGFNEYSKKADEKIARINNKFKTITDKINELEDFL